VRSVVVAAGWRTIDGRKVARTRKKKRCIQGRMGRVERFKKKMEGWRQAVSCKRSGTKHKQEARTVKARERQRQGETKTEKKWGG
jgi:hypothetical protein